jgi:hypothetical protein
VTGRSGPIGLSSASVVQTVFQSGCAEDYNARERQGAQRPAMLS